MYSSYYNHQIGFNSLEVQYTLLEKFWRISLYVTDDSIAKLYSMWRQIVK